MGSYTTKELERDTGFGRRTIAYYVQEGLLPRVGRRGPRTRYPELVRDRLLFIRRVREAEAEGEIRPVPLRDLRGLFEALPQGLVASVAAGETPMTGDIVSLSSVDQRSMVDRVAALRKRLLAEPPELALRSPAPPLHESERMSPPAERPRDLDDDWTHVAAPRPPESWLDDDVVADAPSPPGSPAEPDEDADALGNQLSWVLNELRAQARRRHELAPDTIDTWSQVEVTSDIRLAIRGMADEDAFLLRVAGRLLRQLLESRTPAAERSSDEFEE